MLQRTKARGPVRSSATVRGATRNRAYNAKKCKQQNVERPLRDAAYAGTRVLRETCHYSVTSFDITDRFFTPKRDSTPVRDCLSPRSEHDIVRPATFDRPLNSDHQADCPRLRVPIVACASSYCRVQRIPPFTRCSSHYRSSFFHLLREI
jgi:hypothetical protein